MRRKGDGLLHEYSSFEGLTISTEPFVYFPFFRLAKISRNYLRFTDEDLADVRYLLGSDVGERLPKEPRKRADSTSQAWKRQRSMMPTVWIFLTILGSCFMIWFFSFMFSGGIMALTGYAIDTAVQGLHYRRLQLATLSGTVSFFVVDFYGSSVGIWIVDALLWLLLPILIAVLAAMCGHFISVEAQGIRLHSNSL